MPEKAQKYIVEHLEDDGAGGYIATKAGFLRSKSLTREKETIDSSSDEDPDNATSVAGMKSFGFEFGALYVYDDVGQQKVEAAYDAELPERWRLTNNVTGALAFDGLAHVTSLELTGSTNELLEYSISMEGTGALNKTTIA